MIMKARTGLSSCLGLRVSELRGLREVCKGSPLFRLGMPCAIQVQAGFAGPLLTLDHAAEEANYAKRTLRVTVGSQTAKSESSLVSRAFYEAL